MGLNATGTPDAASRLECLRLDAEVPASNARVLYSELAYTKEGQKFLIENFLPETGDLRKNFVEKLGAEGGEWLKSEEGRQKMDELLKTERGQQWVTTQDDGK